MSDLPYLFCLYAEDVRQETSGQMSIVGVFQGGLRVPAVPTQLPKLSIIANLRLPVTDHPTSVTLEVLLGDAVLQEIEPPADFLQSVAEQKKTGSNDGLTVQFVVGFVGFPVPHEGKLEVRANVDGLVVQGNALEISACQNEVSK